MNITEATEPLIHHMVQHADRQITMKQLSAGMVVIGGGWPATLAGADEHPTVELDSLIGSLSLAQHVIPRIGALRLIRTWAGVNTSVDGRPVVGPVTGVPGLFFAIPGDAGYTLGPADGAAGRRHDARPRAGSADRRLHGGSLQLGSKPYFGPAGGDTEPVAISPLSIATAPHCLDSAFASNRPSAT